MIEMKTYKRKPETVQAYKWEGLDCYTEDDANYLSQARSTIPERICPLCDHLGKEHGTLFLTKNVSQIICPGNIIVIKDGKKKAYSAKQFFGKYEELR